MNTTTITLSTGDQYVVGFDFSVLCEFEELFGTALELDSITSASGQLKVVYAALKAFDNDVKTFREFRHIDRNDFELLSTAVASSMTSFYSHSPGQQTSSSADAGNP